MGTLNRVNKVDCDQVTASKPVLTHVSTQNAEIRLRCYKGFVSVLSRTSETEKLYSSEEASMDSLENFSVLDTSMFLTRHCTPLSTSAPRWKPSSFVSQVKLPLLTDHL